MGALLGQLIAAQRAEQAVARRVPLDCLARVLHAVGENHTLPVTQRGAAAGVPGLVQPLTDRELEVLALLAAGTSNSRIRRGARRHP
jgi:ATP/maltotriose-dependent transcriptional regulator MalT